MGDIKEMRYFVWNVINAADNLTENFCGTWNFILTVLWKLSRKLDKCVKFDYLVLGFVFSFNKESYFRGIKCSKRYEKRGFQADYSNEFLWSIVTNSNTQHPYLRRWKVTKKEMNSVNVAGI